MKATYGVMIVGGILGVLATVGAMDWWAWACRSRADGDPVHAAGLIVLGLVAGGFMAMFAVGAARFTDAK
jgi:hypothetical protein